MFNLRASEVNALTKIHWGGSVSGGWNGEWPLELLTVPEKTGYTRTSSHIEVLEFVSRLAWRNEYMHVERLFISDMRRVAPLVVLSDPRVTEPEEAREAGKTIVYLQGNIHPPEAEGKEALLMLMRDLTLGKLRPLLEEMVVLVCPDFNPDGTETWEVRTTSAFCGTPHIQSLRHNAEDADVNRDGIKMETQNMKGLYANVLNRWDPVLTLDLHSMGRVQHGYANLYAPSYTPTGHSGPRGYTQHTLLPGVRDMARERYGLLFHTHADFDWEDWPPKVWDPVKAGYSVEAKFIVNAIGLRNRMSILTETPGHVGFEKRIYACYGFAATLLQYVEEHGEEMLDVCHAADEEVINDIAERAETGELRNWVEGEYAPQEEPCDLYAYRTRTEEYIPGTSIMRHVLEGEPELVTGVTDLTKPVGTRDSVVPRGYVFPEELEEVASKLRDHGVEVERLKKDVSMEGFEFLVDEFRELEKGWIRMYNMTEFEGRWSRTTKMYPAGSHHVDMAQPLANVAFYCLEPEVGDGFAGWNYFNGYLKRVMTAGDSVVYPVFKYLRFI